jgi:hypothetical protein
MAFGFAKLRHQKLGAATKDWPTIAGQFGRRSRILFAGDQSLARGASSPLAPIVPKRLVVV